MACVYLHKKNFNNEIFYIGIGKYEKRACSYEKRNNYWHNIINKYSFTSEIIYNNLTWESAKNFEIFLINLYGRKDKNEGTLCNMTDGGEGTVGRKHSKEAKLKISKANKGRKHPNKTMWKPLKSNLIITMDMFKNS